ncbi:MAG: NifU family protein [Actinomycetota bacterium]
MTEPVVTITQRAREAVLQARSGQEDARNLALWLEIDGDDGGQYLYDLFLMHIDEAAPGDVVQRHDDLSIVIPRASAPAVQGAKIDLSDDPQFKGWVLDNPNKPPKKTTAGPMIGEDSLFRRPNGGPPASPPIDGPAPDLSGDVAQRVAQIIEHQINPSIASHGGRAELVAIEDDTAFLRLGGGCQGCAMASVTLTQGIKVAITDAVSEISNVVDVTDHASGDNPYFQSSKK